MLISISGNSIEEFKAELRKAWKTFELDADDKQLPLLPAAATTTAATGSAVKEELKKVEEEPKRGRGRPRKVADAAEAAEAEEDAGDDETPPLAPATAAEASEALRDYMGRKGATKAKEALIKFGAGKFSEVKAADYRAFVEHCKSA